MQAGFRPPYVHMYPANCKYALSSADLTPMMSTAEVEMEAAEMYKAMMTDIARNVAQKMLQRDAAISQASPTSAS